MNDFIRTENLNIFDFLHDHKIYEFMGKDTLSAVFNAREMRTGNNVTLIFLRDLIRVPNDRKAFIELVTDVSQLNHPLICRIRKAYVPLDIHDLPETLFQAIVFTKFNLSSVIKTDLIKNKQLSLYTKRYLLSEGRNNQILNPTIRSKVIFGIASLMQYLHSLNINARMLKFEKIYLNDKLEPVFINVGFDYYGPVTTDVEYISGFGDSFKSDVFAFAIVIYKMFSTEEIVENKTKFNFEYVTKVRRGWRPERPNLIPNCYWDLVCRCWNFDQKKVPSFDEIVELLQNDIYAIDEFGMTTDRDALHEYQLRVKNKRYD